MDLKLKDATIENLSCTWLKEEVALSDVEIQKAPKALLFGFCNKNGTRYWFIVPRPKKFVRKLRDFLQDITAYPDALVCKTHSTPKINIRLLNDTFEKNRLSISFGAFNSDATGYAWEVALSPFDLKSILLACEELIQKHSTIGQTEALTAQVTTQI